MYVYDIHIISDKGGHLVGNIHVGSCVDHLFQKTGHDRGVKISVSGKLVEEVNRLDFLTPIVIHRIRYDTRVQFSFVWPIEKFLHIYLPTWEIIICLFLRKEPVSLHEALPSLGIVFCIIYWIPAVLAWTADNFIIFEIIDLCIDFRALHHFMNHLIALGFWNLQCLYQMTKIIVVGIAGKIHFTENSPGLTNISFEKFVNICRDKIILHNIWQFNFNFRKHISKVLLTCNIHLSGDIGKVFQNIKRTVIVHRSSCIPCNIGFLEKTLNILILHKTWTHQLIISLWDFHVLFMSCFFETAINVLWKFIVSQHIAILEILTVFCPILDPVCSFTMETLTV